MAPDTTNPSYWLNWRFLLSAIYVLGTIVLAIFLIWKHEGGKKVDNERRENGLYQSEFYTRMKTFAFVLLLAIITGNVIVSGPGIFFFYTQWTFTLTTIYFGLATTLSLHGCWSDRDGAYHSRITSQNIDAEQGSNVAPKLGGSANMPLLKSLNNREEVHVHHIAGSMCYLLQILYQVAAGAVLLTDVVFWLVIYPFLTGKYYKLAFFDISMHSVNILILGDAILNCMRFPMFRISYFIMWTGAFVICQWIIHACVNLRWPYPFMDLSPPYAPI
ncbi:Coenzyme PQQ synthesis protein B, partial [Bienertia sinuspersici]